MPLKLNPYLVEWIVLPEGADITDEELQRAATEVIAQMNGEDATLFGLPVRKAEKPIVPPDATIVVGPPYINH